MTSPNTIYSVSPIEEGKAVDLNSSSPYLLVRKEDIEYVPVIKVPIAGITTEPPLPAKQPETKRTFNVFIPISIIAIVIAIASIVMNYAQYKVIKGYQQPSMPQQIIDAPQPLERPRSTDILYGSKYNGSEITVTASDSQDCVVSIKDSRGVEYLAFYVRAGATVTMGVPRRKLCVYFATGNEWYGYEKGLMFGENTSYSMDDEELNFAQYTYSYTLEETTAGNFSETPITENDFWG